MTEDGLTPFFEEELPPRRRKINLLSVLGPGGIASQTCLSLKCGTISFPLLVSYSICSCLASNRKDSDWVLIYSQNHIFASLKIRVAGQELSPLILFSCKLFSVGSVAASTIS